MSSEQGEFPIICSKCIGENPYVKMVCTNLLFFKRTISSVYDLGLTPYPIKITLYAI